MSGYLPPFCEYAVRHVYHGATNIRCPDVLGLVAPVLLVDVNGKTIVCKFNDEAIVKKNLIVSDLMKKNNIPTPKIDIHSYRGAWFETYDFIPVKTLHEHIADGLSEKQVLNAYIQAIKIQNKISQIPITEFMPTKYRFHGDVITMHAQGHRSLFAVYKKLLARNAMAGHQILLHCDIHPKNILYSPETGQVFLIDLDAVGLCNETFSMLKMLYHSPLKNHDELMNIYEAETGRQLHRHTIKLSLNTVHTIHNHRGTILQLYTKIQSLTK
ncbi:MAG: phosphotransferase [Alphaproteobacteria bacterium]|nr:phosphotransferase [Alphaproteobacteria bacterium]